MTIYPVGTQVTVNNIPMRISDIMISGSCHRVIYHLTYWEDNEVKSVEVDEDEMVVGDHVPKKRIGFHHK